MNAPDLFRSFLSVVVAALALAGCSAGSTLLARNPLSSSDGATLSATRPPKSDTFQLAKDMIIHPDACAASIDDAIQIAVSKDEVCVHTARNVIVGTSDGGATIKADAVTLTGDDATRALSLPATGSPTEVTTCTAPNGALVHVVRVEHRACTANDGLVTPWTSTLTFDAGNVDEVRWQFDDGRARNDHV
jgi:hypothetical protein